MSLFAISGSLAHHRVRDPVREILREPFTELESATHHRGHQQRLGRIRRGDKPPTIETKDARKRRVTNIVAGTYSPTSA